MKKFLLGLFIGLSFLATSVFALSTYLTTQGGTGTTTPSGIIYGDNGATNHVNTVTIGSNLSFVGGTLSATAGSGITSYDAWTHPAAGQSATTSLMLFNGQASSTQESAYTAYFGGTATTTFFNNGSVGVSSSTPWGFFSINPIAGIGTPSFVIGSSSATRFIVTGGGKVGIGTSAPNSGGYAGNGLTIRDPSNAGYLELIRDISSGNSSIGIFRAGDTSNSTVAGIDFRTDTSGSTGAIDFQTYNGSLLGRMRIDSSGNIGIATTTPQWLLNPFSTTASQLSLSNGADVAQWAFRNAGGNLYVSTTTVAGTATTSISAFNVTGSSGNFGIATDTPGSLLSLGTVGGVNLLANATSTFAKGVDIRGGCFSINQTCLGTGAGTVTSIVNGTGLGGGTITTTGTISLLSYLATSSAETNGRLAYWTTTNGTPAKLGSVATTSETCTGNMSCGAFDVLTGGGAITIINNPTFTTSVTTPLAIGNTTAGGSLTLQSTSGVGTTDSIIFKVGNNGGTTAGAITTAGGWGIGTTTPTMALGSVNISTSTGAGFKPQLIISDQSATANQKHVNLVSQGGTFSIGSTTDAYATSTNQAFSVNMKAGVSAGLQIATGTPETAVTTAIVNLGANPVSTNATTTIHMGRIQFDGMNSGGAATCALISGTVWVITAGACTSN